MRPRQHPAAFLFLGAAPRLQLPQPLPPPSSLSCSHQWQEEGPPSPVPPPTLQQLPGGGRQGEAGCRHAEVPDQHLHQRAGEPAEKKGSAAWGQQGHGDTQPCRVPGVPWPAHLTLRHLPSFTDRITKNPAQKSWNFPAAKQHGGPRHPPGVFCQLHGGVHPSLLLPSSVPAAVGLLGTACLGSPCRPAGSESPGQGPQRGRRALFQFNQQPPALSSLSHCCGRPLVCPHAASAARLLTRGAGDGGYHPCRCACVSPRLGEQDTCAGVTLPTPSPRATWRWACGARGPHGDMQGPGLVLVSAPPPAAMAGWEVMLRGRGKPARPRVALRAV